MMQPAAVTWPPSADLLGWCPKRYDLTEQIAVSNLRRDGALPKWDEIPQQVHEDEERAEEFELASSTLALIELKSTLSDVLWVHALAHPNGGYRIVVRDEYETVFVPPITYTAQPLTMEELLRVLDESKRDGEPDELVGVGQAFRQKLALMGEDRDEAARFVTITSEIYPHLEALDSSRAKLWAADAHE